MDTGSRGRTPFGTRSGERVAMDATHAGRVRRILVLPALLTASLALAACAPGALDAGPPAASGTPDPSPSASATPEPSSPEGGRFDDVDIAAALVPLPFEPGDPQSWGEWTTATRDAILPGLDSEAFAGVPPCVAAVDALASSDPEEIVVAGYPYEDVLVGSIVVARMASGADAGAYVAAVDAAAVACEGVVGTAIERYGVTALRSPLEPSAVIDAAGYGFVALGHDGSNHYYGQAVAAHDELVVMSSSDMMVLGWDETIVADIQTEIAALDAAVGD